VRNRLLPAARTARLAAFALSIAGVFTIATTRLVAQAIPTQYQAPQRAATIGVQGMALVGVNWPRATRSLEATGLDTKPVEIGGAVQVMNIWRDLFAQVSASRTKTTGERVFIDDAGTSFPLGIPLSVKATYVDISAGWKFAPADVDLQNVWTYFGGGAGLVKYAETSPFAQPGDDLESSSASYHLRGGVEVRLLKWLSLSADMLYRWVPNVLGEGGASAAFEEDDFGGFHAGIGLRVGFGGPIRRETPPGTPEPPLATPREPYKVPDRIGESNFGVILAPAEVYLRPDARREPLRILEPGTSVKILQEDQDWIRIEFADRLLGARIGYVLRKYIQLPK
jgi:hypothetical protein